MLDLFGRTALAVERAKVELLTAQIATSTSMNGFLCARVNQLEGERAALLEKLTGVHFPTPHMRATAPAPTTETIIGRPDVGTVLGSLNELFEDMGDARAKENGIRWDARGVVQYPAPSRD